MTRAEIIRAVERQLKRKLTDAELSTIDTTIEIRQGVVTSADIPGIVADFEAGVPVSEPDQFKPGEVGGVYARRSREGDSPTPTTGISSTLRQRAYQAGANAGYTTAEVDAMLTQAFQSVAQARQWAASGQPLPPGMFTDVAQAVEAQVGAWEEEARLARGRPLGVPDNFMAQQPLPRIDSVMGRSVPGEVFGSGVREVEPRYFDGDQYSPAGLSPEKIAEIQKQLVTAGLLTDESFYGGFWDTKTANAYQSVLEWANQRGSTADDALAYLMAHPDQDAIRARNAEKLANTFQAPAYLAPDPATLTEAVKSSVRSKLGREPTDEEMAELSAAMSNTYRADYEAEVAAMRAEFDAQQRGLETGEVQSAGTVQDVDPAARFAQIFDQRFRPELNFIEGQEDTRENIQNVFQSLTNMGRLIG